MRNIFKGLCTVIVTGIFLFSPGDFSLAQDSSEHQRNSQGGEVEYYTCGMHPSVKVNPESYKNGETKCPICSMPLIPVKREKTKQSDLGENVISRVQIEEKELKLADVRSELVKKRRLFKEIRAVGRVAFDPSLAVAEDEFISAFRSYNKAKEGNREGIIARAGALVEASKRKLFLLGLSEEQISDLKKTLKVQDNLILPGKKMWIYGDLFEYELNWVRQGAQVVVRPLSLAGKKFYGKIVSINPVFDPATRTVRFRVLVDNPEGELKPEMYVDIEILSFYTDALGQKDVLSIPKSALLDTGRRKIVWVIKDNGQFEGRAVDVGPEAVDRSDIMRRFYPVLKGLKEGERVVTKGNFLIDSQSQITGVVSSAYGGSLGEDLSKEESMPRKMSGHAH